MSVFWQGGVKSSVRGLGKGRGGYRGPGTRERPLVGKSCLGKPGWRVLDWRVSEWWVTGRVRSSSCSSSRRGSNCSSSRGGNNSCSCSSSRIRGGEDGDVLVGTPSLTGARGQRAGGQRVARLATVGTETSVRTATTLLHGECTLETPGTVHIHGLGTTRRGLVARMGGKEG